MNASTPARALRSILRPFAWCLGAVFKLALAAYFVVALAVLGLRYVALPKVPEYREDIAAAVSRALGAKVTIDALEARWSGLHPTLDVTRLVIHDAEGRPALTLPGVRAQVSWRSLLVWDLRFHSLVFDAPSLAIRRTPDGRFRVGGFEVEGGTQGDQSIGDWVLRQKEILITRGRVQWIDERRGAEALELRDVDFRLVNRFGRVHRVALRAAPPAALASALELRADLRGRSLAELETWDGRAWISLPYADLAVWKRWVDYPIDVGAGRGAVRAWIDFEDAKIVDATVDVALADVRARLDRNAPALELQAVHGRIGAREVREGAGMFTWRERRSAGIAVFGKAIEIDLARMERMAPFDMSLRWDTPPNAPGRGELRASRLDLAPIVRFAESLPLPRELRRIVTAADPRGVISDLRASWTGEIDAPTRFDARLAFEGFGLRAAGNLPGIEPLSGRLEITEAGGRLQASGGPVRLAYPVVYRFDPELRFDKLALEAEWTVRTVDGVRTIEVKAPSFAFSNREIDATGLLTWRSLPDSPTGFLDLDLRVPRAEVNAVHRYIPFVSERAYGWLKHGLVAGSASDGRMRLRGDVWHFPFVEGQHGSFEATAKGSGVVLQYAEDWPRVTDIAGEFALQGPRMRIAAQRATSANANLSQMSARIDWWEVDPTIDIDGNAEAAGADFLAFVRTTPLKDWVGKAIGDMSHEGRARVALNLKVPVAHPVDTRVAGVYQFGGGRFVFDPQQPPLTQVSGRVEFTERGFSARNVAAQFLGGPVSVSATMRGEERVTTINAQGTASVAAVAAQWPFPYAQRVSGQTPYRATVNLGPNGSELLVESTLQGVAIDLPAPLGKAAAEPTAFRLERIADADLAKGRQQIAFSLAQRMSGQVRFRRDGEALAPDRVAIGIGEAAPVLPNRRGVAVAASVASLDWDALLPVLTASGDPQREATAPLPIVGVDLKAQAVTALGRRWTDVTTRATPLERDGWRLALTARELAGNVDWRPDGGGQVLARLKRLAIPDAAAIGGASERAAELKTLPALDINAESFALGGRELGRLQLDAVNEARVWRIRELTLTTPEATLTASGTWQPGRGARQTDVSVAIEASDAGAYLERMGYGGTIAGGAAKLSGTLAWDGPPYAVDYRTLSGALVLNADKGRFLRAQPGVTRLTGVLSLQNLPRRFTFDFRDVFAEGFSYDRIEATATVAKGMLATQDFRMSGPQAGVGIVGELDLANETQDLRVRVVPIVGDSVAAVAALALLNPVIGLSTLIAQRLLKDPIGQALAAEYSITGSWSDPKVDRVFNTDRLPSQEGTPQR